MPTDTERPIRPTLHHVNLKTTRLREMIDWYALVLGTTVNLQFDGGAFVTNDRANHRIGFLALPGFCDDEEKFARTGLHHTAFEYESFADLMATYARLKRHGIEPGVCLDHGVATSLYYSDPDRNMVELQVDNFADWDRSSEWMRTSEEARRNPIGTFFDPEPVMAAHGNGAAFDAILADIRSGKYPPSKTAGIQPAAHAAWGVARMGCSAHAAARDQALRFSRTPRRSSRGRTSSQKYGSSFR
jgi:catechol 2,3-dioxygenase